MVGQSFIIIIIILKMNLYLHLKKKAVQIQNCRGMVEGLKIWVHFSSFLKYMDTYLLHF